MREDSIDDVVNIAEEMIARNGICLLLFDVIGSQRLSSERRYLLQKELREMMDDLNSNFDSYMPEHDIAVYGRKEKGFTHLIGDGSWAGISEASVIPKIIGYQHERYPEIPLRWGVAEDGYDRENTRIVK